MTRRPDVIVLLTDQQRWDTTGYSGNPLGLTPQLDALARAGTVFDVAITPQPLCTPARASLQSGQFATRTGAYRNGIVPNVPGGSLADVFREAGYRTAYVGKWHLGASTSRGPVQPDERLGYEQWFAANSLEHTSEPYRTSLWDEGGNEVRVPGYRVDAIADAAIRLLVQEDDRPLFLFVSFLEPHQQNRNDDFVPPAVPGATTASSWMPPDLQSLGGNAAEKLPGYNQMIKRLDEAVGRVADAVKSWDRADSTVFAFTSDHGCHFKTRNWEYKRSVHDSSVRVPFVLSGPKVPRGRWVDEVVSTLDLPATLIDIAGLTPPDSFDSRSLLPLMWGTAEGEDEAYVQVSESEVARAVRTRRWKYGVVAREADPLQEATSAKYEEAYLFDLAHDPWELNNLIGFEPFREVASRMRERMQAWMERAGEPQADIESIERVVPMHSQYRVLESELPAVRSDVGS